MKYKDRVLKAIWKADNNYQYIIATSMTEDTSKSLYDSRFETRLTFVLLDKKRKCYVESMGRLHW